MARLYSNENFDLTVVNLLRKLNHDVLTSKEAGNANLGIPDDAVFAFAHADNRVVVTYNYQHFKKLHRLSPDHSGIIICTEDKDLPALAQRIHNAILSEGDTLQGKLIRVNRPNPSGKE